MRNRTASVRKVAARHEARNKLQDVLPYFFSQIDPYDRASIANQLVDRLVGYLSAPSCTGELSFQSICSEASEICGKDLSGHLKIDLTQAPDTQGLMGELNLILNSPIISISPSLEGVVFLRNT
jgi:hypothetical protein